MRLDTVLPSSIKSLLLPVALGLGVAVLLYAGISMLLTWSVGPTASAADRMEEASLPASEVAIRFATALIAGDKDGMSRYAAGAEVVRDMYPASYDDDSPEEALAREIRKHVARLELTRIEVERMAPQNGKMAVEVIIHAFDPIHFDRWTEYNPAYNKALDEVIADHAGSYSDAPIDELDRTANLLTIADAGAEAFAAVQNAISSVKQSYVDDFFSAVGPDARYMLEPYTATTFLLEHRKNRWLVTTPN